jgi:serine/threonine protein kinase
MEDSALVRPLIIDEKFKLNITDLFEIKEIIGFGSFGVVSKVLRKQDKRAFAMKKIFLKKMPYMNNALQETLQEIAVLSQCSHPHIINFIGYEVLDNEISYIMELMDYSLEDYMKEKLMENTFALAVLADNSIKAETLPELNKALILKIFYQSLSALNYLLLNFNMTHRDIKPENILLNENFDVKVSDFGTLKVMQGTPNKGFVTRSETIVGTPCYLAPELKKALVEIESGHSPQLKPKVNFTKCDVFSLGMSILRLIAGVQFEKLKGNLNTDEDCLRKLLVEVKNEIPLEIYDTLFVMLSFDVNIRPDIRMLYLMVQRKENLLNKLAALQFQNNDNDGSITPGGLISPGNLINLQKKQSELMDLSNIFQ